MITPQAIPAYNQIFNGRVAAADVFDVIDRKSAIDPFSDSGRLVACPSVLV
jgi:hypothetical protein